MTSGKRSRLGRMLVIGGAEDPDPHDMRILPRLVEMAGGERARVLVCSTPSSEPEETARRYGRLLRGIGVAEVVEAPVANRGEADDPSLLEAAERVTAVLFTGGDQLRLTSQFSGTTLSERIRERLFDDRLVVAGTSAGAAAMSSTMIVGGPGKGTVRRSDVELAPGLGYWRDTVVDTHFNQRGRVHRLLTIFAHNPQVLGIGIDENTALELVPGERFTVLGEGAVMVFNGRVSHSNAPDAGAEDTLAITDSVVHVLPAGYGYHMRSKRPVLPGGHEVEERRGGMRSPAEPAE